MKVPHQSKSKKANTTLAALCWRIFYCSVCSVPCLSSLGNAHLGPCVQPMGGVHISWLVSSEHSESFLMSLLLGPLEDGGPLFGVWSVVFARMREGASRAWNCVLFIVSLLDILRAFHSCLSRSQAWPQRGRWCARRCTATGFDGELIFGCKWVQQIHISHALVVGTNNVWPLNFNVGSDGFVPVLNLLHGFRSSKGCSYVMNSPIKELL